MKGTNRPLRRSEMARWRATNSSCMGTSVVRPLAVAHGGHSSRIEEGKKVHGAVTARTTDRERSDQLSSQFNQNEAISCRQKTKRSAVGSQITCNPIIGRGTS